MHVCMYMYSMILGKCAWRTYAYVYIFMYIYMCDWIRAFTCINA